MLQWGGNALAVEAARTRTSILAARSLECSTCVVVASLIAKQAFEGQLAVRSCHKVSTDIHADDDVLLHQPDVAANDVS